jgi:drug/metabolite transporter (DMT)-like permease
MWYQALPSLPTTVAGIAQLSVPVIAVTAGVAFLNEPLTMRLLIASVLVLGGITVCLTARRSVTFALGGLLRRTDTTY